MSKFYTALENVIKLKGFGSTHDNEPVWNAIEDLQSYGYENPMNPQQTVLDGVAVELEAINGDLLVKFIGASKKGRGNGTMVMKEIIDTAKQHGVDIVLYPHPVGDTTKEQLIKWYTKLGFESNGDSMKFSV